MPARMITAMLVALLISIPAFAQDVNAQLLEAAKKGQTSEVLALLIAGAKVKEKDDKGWTALMYAAQGGHTETVQVLLDAGAKVKEKDDSGKTALMGTAMNGHTQTMQVLLAKGAQVNVQTKDNGNTDIAAINPVFTGKIGSTWK